MAATFALHGWWRTSCLIAGGV
ncbi:hypothetical protein DOW39_10900 [Salmonella enterica subsp. enterica serovar Tanger]|nr:hypothetical protein [Salmonella enterica subsp. enterica serovar Tanger]EBV4602158.1 hypothetical protein [Salmonella enterica subsp. enterica serovar Tanger]